MKKLLLLLIASCTIDQEVLPTTLEGEPWTMTTVAAPVECIGADGFKLGNDDRAVIPCEQSGSVIVAHIDGGDFEIVGDNNGTEDAILVDLDQDGVDDVVFSASEGERRVRADFLDDSAHFTIAASNHLQRFMQLAWCDFGDGFHLYAGGKSVKSNGVITSPGWIGRFSITDATSASGYAWEEIADVGWTMALQCTDAGLYLSDRNALGAGRGSWIYEPPSWTPHRISSWGGDVGIGIHGAVDGDAYPDVVDGNKSAIYLHRGTSDPLVFSTAELIPYPTGAGDFHAASLCDVDADADVEIVLSFALSQIGESWVVYMDPTSSGYVAADVSGPATVIRKPDNVACLPGGALGVSEGGDSYKLDDLKAVRFDPPL